jgi:hypothetical protein
MTVTPVSGRIGGADFPLDAAACGVDAGLWKAGARMPEKEFPGRASNGKF